MDTFFVDCVSSFDPVENSFSSTVPLTFWEFLVLPESTSTTFSFYHSPPYFPSDHAHNIHHPFFPSILSIDPPVHSSIHSPLHPSINPPAHSPLPTYPSIHPHIHPFIHPFIHPSIHTCG